MLGKEGPSETRSAGGPCRLRGWRQGMECWGAGSGSALGLAELGRLSASSHRHPGQVQRLWAHLSAVVLSSSSSCSLAGKFPCIPITLARSTGPAAALKTAGPAQPSPKTTSSGKPSLALTGLFSRAPGSWMAALVSTQPLAHHRSSINSWWATRPCSPF